MLVLCSLLFLLESVTPLCPSFFGVNSKRSEKCSHKASTNSTGAGLARNVKGRCRYDEYSPNQFYYEITWDPPEPSETPVAEYAVRITYYGVWYVCFRVPPTQHRIIFNESTGLQYKCWFAFSVTPQPVLFVDGTYRDTERFHARCPIALQLLPLPNILAHAGADVSFKAEFEEIPIPYPKIKWYFSTDKIHCRYPRRIKSTERHLLLSANRMILTVRNITAKQKGCYIVKAISPGGGLIHQQRGYIDLN